jgi:hypothetical protein
MVVRWVDDFGGLLKTRATEQEIFDVVQRPCIAENAVPLFAARLRRIFAAAELLTIAEHVTGCRDPKDDKFLEHGRERPCTEGFETADLRAARVMLEKLRYDRVDVGR